MAGWGCTDQKAKDRKKCENEAMLQEIKIPVTFCSKPCLQHYKTICSKPKSQCGTQVRLRAKDQKISKANYVWRPQFSQKKEHWDNFE